VFVKSSSWRRDQENKEAKKVATIPRIINRWRFSTSDSHGGFGEAKKARPIGALALT
jgi:hypothetical protein